jgi:hypothetical protein
LGGYVFCPFCYLIKVSLDVDDILAFINEMVTCKRLIFLKCQTH